jgi:hypothetical protein
MLADPGLIFQIIDEEMDMHTILIVMAVEVDGVPLSAT